MRISTKIILLIETGEVLARECFEYDGPIAEAVQGSGGMSKSKSKSQQQAQQTSESGTKFNEDFLAEALEFASAQPGRRTITVQPSEGAFNAERYLAENPDIAGNKFFAADPYEHWLRHGKAEGRKFPGQSSEGGDAEIDIPGYDPKFIRSAYASGAYTPGEFTGTNFTGGNYTGGKYTGADYVPVEGGDFDRLEQALYGKQEAGLSRAYNQSVNRQREELSQMGALNSPAQYLEGSTRSSLDRSFLENLQQAARDAATTTLGLKATEAARRTGFNVGEAGRRTGFDVGEAGRRTGYDVGEAERRTGLDLAEAQRRTGFSTAEAARRSGFDTDEARRLTDYSTGEAGRETGFNVDTATKLLESFLKKLGIAIESGRYSYGQGTSAGSSSSSSTSIQGSGGIMKFS